MQVGGRGQHNRVGLKINIRNACEMRNLALPRHRIDDANKLDLRHGTRVLEMARANQPDARNEQPHITAPICQGTNS